MTRNGSCSVRIDMVIYIIVHIGYCSIRFLSMIDLVTLQYSTMLMIRIAVLLFLRITGMCTACPLAQLSYSLRIPTVQIPTPHPSSPLDVGTVSGSIEAES